MFPGRSLGAWRAGSSGEDSCWEGSRSTLGWEPACKCGGGRHGACERNWVRTLCSSPALLKEAEALFPTPWPWAAQPGLPAGPALGWAPREPYRQTSSQVTVLPWLPTLTVNLLTCLLIADLSLPICKMGIILSPSQLLRVGQLTCVVTQ